jgi:hypothetical protein
MSSRKEEETSHKSFLSFLSLHVFHKQDVFLCTSGTCPEK